MERRVALLRGINLGPRNRIAMGDLREALAAAGYAEVRTYVQSGNVVLVTQVPPEELEDELERLIAERWGFSVPVIVRTPDELARVVKRNPFAEVANNPKRYQVSFLSAELDSPRVERLHALAGEAERFVAIGRELYAWHPDGIARSKLWAKLAAADLPVKATARNWSTVEKLLEMARA
jgi:uncharacterized protein (DUF1697 family)